jgi:hypothetical protein
VTGWWTRDYSAQPVPGADVDFNFGDRYRNCVQVVRCERPTAVVWQVLAGDAEWVGTTIEFNLSPADGGQTIVRFGHCGWREATDFFRILRLPLGLVHDQLEELCRKGPRRTA